MPIVRKTYVFNPGEALRLKKHHLPGDKFFCFTSPTTFILLTLSEDRRLFDEEGFEYGCVDELLMTDTTTRTGIGIFSLPEGHYTEAASGPHDFQHSSTIYQLSNPRSTAEREFKERLGIVGNSAGRKVLNSVLTTITQAFGWAFWDNKKTRWK